VAGVDEPVEEGFCDDGVGEQAVPVLGCPVRGDDQRVAISDALGDGFVEVVGLLCGELAQGEVVGDERGGFRVGGQAFGGGAVGVSAGEVGRQFAGLVGPRFGAGARREVAQPLGEVGLADSDRPVEQD
jgi:hypothetical protein